MLEYAMYLRKSRSDIELEARGEMETLARHENTLLELARRQKLPVACIYKEVVSGETIQDRPVIQKLLSEVSMGRWSGVLVMEIERLARGDTVDQGMVARAFKLGRAKIVTPLKIYDPLDEFDEEYFEFGLFMSRREYKTINRRIQRGRLVSVREGKYIGSTPPYGYDRIKIPDDKGYTLRPNQDAGTVQMVFQMYSAGITTQEIVRRLEQLCIKTKRGGPWSRSTVHDLLKNPVYAGKIRWGARPETRIQQDGLLVKKRMKATAPIFVQGKHPPIIDNALFERVQAQITQNTVQKVRKDFSLKNPFSGLIFCGKCGAPVTRQGANRSTPYDTLRCSKRCGNVSIPLEMAERELLHGLAEWMEGYRIQISPYFAAGYEKNITQHREHTLKEMREEKKKIQQQTENTFNLLEQGLYSHAVFKQRKAILNRKNKELSLAIEALENEKKQASPTLSFHETTVQERGLWECYQALALPEEKNRFLHQILYRIEYTKQKPSGRGAKDCFRLSIYPKLPEKQRDL